MATITGMSSPFLVAANTATNRVYVTNYNANDVAVIDGATNTVVATVPVGTSPGGIAVDTSKNLVYVANQLSATISVINGETNTVARTFTLPSSASPGNVAVDPSANHLFVADGFNKVVYVLNTSTGALLATITGGKVPFKGPVDPAVFQPGKTVLISDNQLNAVEQISESNFAVSAGYKGGSSPAGVAVNQTTHVVYVAEEGNNTVIAYAP